MVCDCSKVELMLFCFPLLTSSRANLVGYVSGPDTDLHILENQKYEIQLLLKPTPGMTGREKLVIFGRNPKIPK
jgi:hypothetical protein